MNNYFFNADYLYSKALDDFCSFKDMYEYVQSAEAMDSHKNSLSLISSGEPIPNAREHLESELESSIINSMNHFAALSITGLCTSFEIAAKEFFFNLFLKCPQYMYDYLNNEKKSATVPLGEIVEAKDYQILIESLAQKASGIASKGKYKEVVKRAYRLCAVSENSQFLEKINTLQIERWNDPEILDIFSIG